MMRVFNHGLARMRGVYICVRLCLYLFLAFLFVSAASVIVKWWPYGKSPCGSPLWSSWTELLGFALAIVGALIAWHQWRKSCAVTRSEHLREMLAAFKEKDISETFYVCINNASYGGNAPDDPEFYKGGLRFEKIQDIDEGCIDNMLLRFSAICHDHHLGVISDDEFEFFSFQIRRALAHAQIKRYLYDMAEYCGKYTCGYMFHDLIEEGLQVDQKHYSRAISLVRHKLAFAQIVKEGWQWFNI